MNKIFCKGKITHAMRGLKWRPGVQVKRRSARGPGTVRFLPKPTALMHRPMNF